MRNREVILIKNYHPHEEAAAAMVSPLAKKLSEFGVRVSIIDLEEDLPVYSRSEWEEREPLQKREKMVRDIARQHPGALIIEVHNCEEKQKKAFIVSYGRSLALEIPAIWIPQTGADFESRSGMRRLVGEKASLDLSREKGFCNDETLERCADLIFGRTVEFL